MKELLNQFDLDNAFKALDEMEYPTVKGGIRPNRMDLHEHFSRKPKTDLLIEEYYNVSSDADLMDAQEQRNDEIAQAKLDRIEKIVDLDADSEEDLQAAYVGKYVIQCPQCMTLFYKKPEDVTTSEEDPSLANVGELCPNCSNDSGFTVVGKIEDATPEAAPVEEAPTEEGGLEEMPTEGGEEAPVEGEEDLDLDLDLGDLDLDIEETEEQEPTEESLNLSKALKDASKKTELDTENHSENLTLNESAENEKITTYFLDCSGSWGAKDWVQESEEIKNATGPVNIYYFSDHIYTNPYQAKAGSASFAYPEIIKYAQEHPDEHCIVKTDDDYKGNALYLGYDPKELETTSNIELRLDNNSYPKFESVNLSKAQKAASKNTELDTENHSENLSLNESADVKAELKDYNEYIEYLQKQIAADEEELKKANNDFVKDSIQRRLDGYRADLDVAMPQILKDAVDEQNVADEEVDAALADLDIDADVSTDAATLQDESNTGEQEEASAEEEEVEVKEALNEGCEGKDCKEDVNILSGNSSSIDLGDAGAAIGAALPLLADDEGEKQAHAESNAEMDAEMLNEAAMTWEEKVEEADRLLYELCTGIDLLDDPDDGDGYWYSDDAWCNRNLYYRGNFPKKVVDYLEKNIPLYNSKLQGIDFYYTSDEVPDDEYDEDDNAPAEVGYTLTDSGTTNEGCEGKDYDKALTEAESAEDAALDRLYDSKEFRTPVPQSVIDNFFNEDISDTVQIKDIEELDDDTLTETVNKYLKEVYENVDNFKLTNCQVNESTGQLFVEGDIKFKSGKTKPTAFAFNSCGQRFLEGYNFDLCETKAFKLYGKMEDKKFITEGLGYRYHIYDDLVKGIARR